MFRTLRGIWKDTEAADRVVDQVFGDQVKELWNNPDFVVEDMPTLPDTPTDAETARNLHCIYFILALLKSKPWILGYTGQTTTFYERYFKHLSDLLKEVLPGMYQQYVHRIIQSLKNEETLMEHKLWMYLMEIITTIQLGSLDLTSTNVPEQDKAFHREVRAKGNITVEMSYRANHEFPMSGLASFGKRLTFGKL